jgi:hypothetical protein
MIWLKLQMKAIYQFKIIQKGQLLELKIPQSFIFLNDNSFNYLHDLIYFNFESVTCNLLNHVYMGFILLKHFCDFYFKFFFFFFFFDRTGVWTQGFALTKQGLFHLNHTFSLFCSGYFGDGGYVKYLLGLAANRDPPNLSFPNS